MTLAVVVPVYNEAAGLEEFAGVVQQVLETLDFRWEVLFVDDGSTDESWDIIVRLSRRNPQFKGLRLSRNFGHQIALSAGLDQIQADVVLMMDADLQHPPELIPELIARWREGYDVVNTIREDSLDTPWFKRATASAFYWLINRLSEVPVVHGAADFRLLDRRALDSLRAMPERHRFLRGMVSWIGFSQTYITYHPRQRVHGVSKYTLKKMWNLGMDGITSFSVVPLRLSLMLGAISIAITVIYAGYVLWMKFFTHGTEPGWASLMGVILFFGGVQLMSLGILGEYLGKIFGEIKQRPLYLIAQTVGISEHMRQREPV